MTATIAQAARLKPQARKAGTSYVEDCVVEVIDTAVNVSQSSEVKAEEDEREFDRQHSPMCAGTIAAGQPSAPVQIQQSPRDELINRYSQCQQQYDKRLAFSVQGEPAGNDREHRALM